MSENAALTAAQIYTSIKGEVDRKSKEELRKEVLAEMESTYGKTISDLKSEVATLKADLKSSQSEGLAEKRITAASKKSSDNLIASLKSEISNLKTSIREKAQGVSVNKQELAEKTQKIKDDLRQEKLKSSKLDLQIATLTGKLSEKKTTKTVSVVAPSPIPSFDIKPIRGQDGRISGATVTPIGIN